MWKLFSDEGWRKKEPGKQYPTERPKLFCQLVLHAYAEELITASKASELLRMPITELRAIGNVDICEYQAVNQ